MPSNEFALTTSEQFMPKAHSSEKNHVRNDAKVPISEILFPCISHIRINVLFEKKPTREK